MHKLACTAVLSLLIFGSSAYARDNGQFGTSLDPQIKDWIKGLKDRLGYGCCDVADGYPPEVVWYLGNNGYRVQILGKSYEVPESALVRGPNNLGRAIVWYTLVLKDGIPEITIRCFIPGPLV